MLSFNDLYSGVMSRKPQARPDVGTRVPKPDGPLASSCVTRDTKGRCVAAPAFSLMRHTQGVGGWLVSTPCASASTRLPPRHERTSGDLVRSSEVSMTRPAVVLAC